MSTGSSGGSIKRSQTKNFLRNVCGPARSTARPDPLTQRLNDYFNLLQSFLELTGYSTINVLALDHGHGVAGHKVLIRDMPARHRKTEAAIRKLPDSRQMVIYARYGLFRDDQGRLLTNQQKADAIDYTLGHFKDELKAARRFLRRELSC